MTHEGGGPKPSAKKSKAKSPDHAQIARDFLMESEAEIEQIDWDAYEESHLGKAELALKAAHVHALLALVDASKPDVTFTGVAAAIGRPAWVQPYGQAFPG